jgi:hypothetical protein
MKFGLPKKRRVTYYKGYPLFCCAVLIGVGKSTSKSTVGIN